jgi:hypothetical protein
MSWEKFRLEFPQTSYYDDAFSYYQNFYGTLQNIQILRHEIVGYAEFQKRIDESEQNHEHFKKTFPWFEQYTENLDDRLPALEEELKTLLAKKMNNDEQERVASLCNTILHFKVTDDMFVAVEILIRNVYGAALIESFIQKLVKALPSGSKEIKRLSISLDLEYSLEAMKKISEARDA